MRSIRPSTIIRLLTIVAAVLLVIFYFELSDSTAQFWTVGGLVLSELVCLTLFLVMGSFARRFPLSILAATVILLFVVSRLVVLAFNPEEILSYFRISSALFNRTLLFMLLGTIACFMGIAAGYMVRPRLVSQQPTRERVNPQFLVRAVVAVAFVKLFIYYSLGYVGATGSGEGLSFFQRYVSRVADPFVFVLVFLTAYFLERPDKRRPIHVVIALGALFVAQFFAGSRSAPLEIVMFVLATTVYLKGDSRVSLNARIVAATTAILAVGVLGYPVAQALREPQWRGGDTSFKTLSSSILSLDNYDERLPFEISRRMSLVDPTFYVLSAADLNMGDISDLVNAKVTLLSSVNRLIPGKPLGNILFTEYAFGYIFDPRNGISLTAGNGRVDNVGYNWGMYGISYQCFGFVGGLVFIAVFSAALVFLMRWAQRRSTFLRKSVGLSLAYSFVPWITNYGLDNFFDATVHFIALTSCLAFVCQALSRRIAVPQGRSLAQRSQHRSAV